MKMSDADKKKRVKELQAEIKKLQAQLEQANKREGIDPYIDVKIQKNQANFKRIKKKGKEDEALGNFFIKIGITAEQQNVYVPLSVASGKKVVGFMYQIEGNAIGNIDSTDIAVQGEGVSQVAIGTLLFAKIPAGKTASFRIQVRINGDFGKTYKIVITRLNYKLDLTQHRYNQYLKEIRSDSVKLS